MATDDLSGADVAEARRRHQRKHRVVGLPVAGLIVLGGCGLAMVGIATSRVGIMAAIVGALAALLPVGVVVATAVSINRWEPEPPLVMLGAFLWGASGATASALTLNDAVTGIARRMLSPASEIFVAQVVMAPLVEEAAKALFVVTLWLRRRSEFHGLLDGIVYATLTAAGFAFIENIFYFGRAFAQDGLGNASGGVVAVFLLRGILAPFSHPLFSSMVGIGIGLAARARRRWVQVLLPVTGFVAATVLHAVWNDATLLGGLEFLNIYSIIMVPVFFGTGWLVAWQRNRERRIVVEQLPVLERAGVIAAGERELLASLAGRRGWKRKVRRSAGADAAKAVREYQIAVTELAFLLHRFNTGYAQSGIREPEHPARQTRRQRLIEELNVAKRSAAGTGHALRTAEVDIDELTRRYAR